MKVLITFLLSIAISCPVVAGELPQTVRDALRQARIPQSSIGMMVQEINAAAPLIEVNAQQAMNPASTIKLLTTFGALEILGPAYTWRTEAYIDGKLENGILDGNLIIKGYGNPKLNAEHLWLWLHELRNRGLREIRGNLLLDRSAFAVQESDPAAFDNDPLRAYNVAPDALLLNFNAVRLHFIPQEKSVQVYTEPALAGVNLDNQLKLKQQNRCGGWDDNIQFDIAGSANVIRLTGSYPAICGERDKAFSLLPYTQYFGGVFKQIWGEMGGLLTGRVMDSPVTSSAILFSTQYSQPLSEIIRDINKYSNNVMTRQIFLTLSLEREAPTRNIPNGYEKFFLPASGVLPAGSMPQPATVERSEAALRHWLAQKGLEFPELVLENGAGLSRKERISAASMVTLLREIQRSPYSAEIEASLPIVGIDGTMRKRHDNCAVTAHGHLKTGSLEGVKSMAGYLQSKSGKQWLIVFFVNHPHAAQGQAAQDELLEWLMENN